jgi:hypothetical protein
MNVQLLLTFIILNILNVVIQTIKSIATVKCGKGIAALVNAIAYGLYTIVTVYMLCELPLFWKAGIVALCNLVGVYAVKWGEEKSRKDKLWKVEATVNPIHFDRLKNIFEKNGIPFSYIDVNKYVIFNLYCATQKDSQFVKSVLDHHEAKYFVSESKTL